MKKIHTLDNLAKIVSKLKNKSKSVVLCHGVFDLLHVGHIKHLKKAKSLEGNLKCLEIYLKQLHKLTTENLKINDIALNYVINQPFIDAVLIGVDNPNQLNLNLESINKYIPKSILEYINSIKVNEKELLNPFNWK